MTTESRGREKWRGFPHVLSGRQFVRSWLEGVLFPLADQMEGVARARNDTRLAGKSVRTLFFEPSERTQDSFTSAIRLLGGITMELGNPAVFSSMAKGESLEDMVRVVGCYEHDAIVMRSKVEGEVARAAAVSSIPVINAGDGAGEHPTQALLDAYTIHKALGGIDGIRIALFGDLKASRTIHSLTYLLTQWKFEAIYLVGLPSIDLPAEVLNFLEGYNRVRVTHSPSLSAVIEGVDIVYLTRLQSERYPNIVGLTGEESGRVKLSRGLLDRIPSHAKVLHPLPRSTAWGELPEELTEDPKIAIFDQVRNGLLIRMALLDLILNR